MPDATAYDELIGRDQTCPKALLTDRGFDSDAIRQDAWLYGTDPVIPTMIDRKVQRPVNPLLYALRKRIERFFNKLKNARRVATRYDKTADSFLAFVQLASIKIWLRFVNRLARDSHFLGFNLTLRCRYSILARAKYFSSFRL